MENVTKNCLCSVAPMTVGPVTSFILCRMNLQFTYQCVCNVSGICVSSSHINTSYAANVLPQTHIKRYFIGDEHDRWIVYIFNRKNKVSRLMRLIVFSFSTHLHSIYLRAGFISLFYSTLFFIFFCHFAKRIDFVEFCSYKEYTFLNSNKNKIIN